MIKTTERKVKVLHAQDYTAPHDHSILYELISEPDGEIQLNYVGRI